MMIAMVPRGPSLLSLATARTVLIKMVARHPRHPPTYLANVDISPAQVPSFLRHAFRRALVVDIISEVVNRTYCNSPKFRRRRSSERPLKVEFGEHIFDALGCIRARRRFIVK
jgi:hypothetical protein